MEPVILRIKTVYALFLVLILRILDFIRRLRRMNQEEKISGDVQTMSPIVYPRKTEYTGTRGRRPTRTRRYKKPKVFRKGGRVIATTKSTFHRPSDKPRDLED